MLTTQSKINRTIARLPRTIHRYFMTYVPTFPTTLLLYSHPATCPTYTLFLTISATDFLPFPTVSVPSPNITYSTLLHPPPPHYLALPPPNSLALLLPLPPQIPIVHLPVPSHHAPYPTPFQSHYSSHHPWPTISNHCPRVAPQSPPHLPSPTTFPINDPPTTPTPNQTHTTPFPATYSTAIPETTQGR